ncbi:MAG TPA: universal stress protein [Chthonomonadaceae bacterium]|nr:universal stress protein [Chthonomonadaceae bacterium]
MFQTLLVCSDGSRGALKAAHKAAAIARQFNSDIRLLSVFDDTLTAAYLGAWESITVPGDLARLAEETQGEVECRTLPIFQQAGVPCQALREIGHAVDRITQVAEREHANLIVLGSRGLSTWQALLLGSVSEGVLLHAPCPVLIVRGEKASEETTGFNRILLATDGSDNALGAAAMAGLLADKFGAELTALHVVAPPRGLLGVPVADTELKAYRERMQAAVKQRTGRILGQTGIPYAFREEDGHPAEEIVRVAAEGNYDLIVLGSRGLSGWKSLLVGSVSQRVARHAPCSVLVVR